MNDIDVLSVAKERGIRVKRYGFLEIDGICTSVRWRGYVWIRSWMDEIHERETIAHEIAHLEDWTEHFMHAIAEKRAEKWKREILIPYDRLVEAIESYGEHGTEFLAKLFGVRNETMEKRINEVFKR